MCRHGRESLSAPVGYERHLSQFRKSMPASLAEAACASASSVEGRSGVEAVSLCDNARASRNGLCFALSHRCHRQTRTRNKPCAGAVEPAYCRWPDCRMVAMASAGIWARPMATSVPTIVRAMCCRKPSALSTKTRRSACRTIRKKKRQRHGLRAVQEAARNAEKS